MLGLAHDGQLGYPGTGRSGYMAGPEAMPTDVAGQTRAVRGFLNDSGDRVGCKRPIGDPATFPHGALKTGPLSI